MAHLAGALGIDLAVQVQVGAGQGQDLLPGGRLGAVTVLEPQVAQQVQHHGGAVLARLHQGQVGHAAHLQLELRHVQRVLAVVAAVVRARGDLVDHELAVVQHKEFHAQHAHIVKTDSYGFRSGYRLLRLRCGQISFIHLGHGQDAIAVQVALHGQVDDGAVPAARHDD